MRKRLLIGAIAMVVIGVAAYVLSQPRNGSVEYHKREYLKAWNGGPFPKLPEVCPDAVADVYLGHVAKKRKFHEEALLSAGFLGERFFFVSNRAPRFLSGELRRAMTNLAPNTEDIGFPILMEGHVNTLTVVAPSSLLTNIDVLVRKLDVPAETE